MTITPHPDLLPHLSPEQRIVIGCAAAVMDGAPNAVLAALIAGPLDWPSVPAVGERHRLLGPLRWTLLRPEFAGAVPALVLSKLDAAWFTTVARSLMFDRELGRALAAFNAAGIPVIALKGAALAHTVYPDPALRPMGDLDLLVAEGRLPAAEATLMGFDYAARERPDRQVRMRGAGKHSPALSSPGGAVVFELHRHIVNHFPHYDLAGFWERARPATLAGQTALVPAPEDMLIHLSLHFFGDRLVSGRGAIGQLWDIAMTVRRAGDSFDWALLTAETRRFGLKGPVGLALAAAHAFFGTPSEGQVRSLAPEAFDVAAVRRFLERRVLAGGERYANGLVEANTEYSARNAARGVLAFLFPTPTYLDDRRALLGSPEGTGALYLRHYLRLPRHILTALRQARSSLRDLQPDRFMHRLAQSETGPDRSPE